MAVGCMFGSSGGYIPAYGIGFGASGLTFYDAEVVRFFSPHAGGLDAIFVTALGRTGSTQSGMLISNAIQPPPRRS